MLLKQMRQRRADDDAERAESGAARRALRARRDREPRGRTSFARASRRGITSRARVASRRHIATTPRSMGERGDDGARDGAGAVVVVDRRRPSPWSCSRAASSCAPCRRGPTRVGRPGWRTRSARWSALTHQYDRAWREIASDVLHRGVVPANGALSALPIVYVDGGCACEVWDYRGGAANAVADVRTVRLRATSATIARDAEIEANAMEALEDEDAATMRRLRLEGALLAATKPALRLESPSREDAS